jgi:signal transduction histidine kinase
MGGRLTAEDTPGGGLTAVISLPKAAGDTEASEDARAGLPKLQ